MSHHRCLLLVVLPLAALAASACGTGEGEPGPGQEVPFTVCSSSKTWTRPSEEEQAKEIWARARYAGRDTDELRDQLHENFFFWHGGNSELFDSWPLHGLWSASDAEDNEEGQLIESGDVFLEKVIWLYLLSYEAKEVRLFDNTYEITVEKTPAGFQAIAFDNVLLPESEEERYRTTKGSYWPNYFVVIVDTSGRELARTIPVLQELPSESP
jgi:hypothetical protein